MNWKGWWYWDSIWRLWLKYLVRRCFSVFRWQKTVLDSFWEWLDQQKFRKGSRFEKAVNYTQNRKSYLMTYLEDGHCSISNNFSENAIHPFIVGRKHWLFSNSPQGASASFNLYILVEMAKAHDLNIYQYLLLW